MLETCLDIKLFMYIIGTFEYQNTYNQNIKILSYIIQKNKF